MAYSRTLIALAVVTVAASFAVAQNNWPTPAANNRAQGVVIMCLNGSNQAIPATSSGDCIGGGGGGGGAATIADGADVTQGAKADSACGTDTGTCTGVALLKRLLQGITSLIAAVTSPIPTGTNFMGYVGSAFNVTPVDCSGTIATGGTSQNAFGASSTKHSGDIQNVSLEPMTISWTGAAGAVNTAGSFMLNPATTTTAGGAYHFNVGYNTALRVNGPTTGNPYTCTYN